MVTFKHSGTCRGVLLLAIAVPVGMAHAEAEDESFFGRLWENAQISGFVRADFAYKATDDQNPNNQRGDPYNHKTIGRCAAVPPSGVCMFPDTVSRGIEPADDDWNLTQYRLQVDMNLPLSQNWSFTGKLRAVLDSHEYDQFDPAAIGSRAARPLYQSPNYFDFELANGKDPTPLEWTGRDYMIDLPALFVTYQQGPLTVRAGNQQIAWGQALFFRVLDVPNGLDLRRHLILDYGPEEYADERVPSLALRTSYQMGDDWELDGYVQKFQPSIYANPNTPYNLITAQFTVQDLYGDYDEKLNYGIRMRGRLAGLGLQAIFADRYNPDGVFRWTASNVNRDLPGLPGSGTILQQTPFEVDSSGVYSAHEWFSAAGSSRLNGMTALSSAINEFPAAQLLGARPVTSPTAAARELDLFFQLSGGMRGHIAREYFREKDFGLGASYVFESEPGTLLDQLIVNFETLYQRDRTYTNTSLSRNYLRDDEWTFALIAEKYHRLSANFPATYIVGQFLHKTKSDLFGRHLSGMGGFDNSTGTDPSDYHIARGISNGANYAVLAFQQPFPNLIWRVDFSALYDFEGGLLLQPAVRWKPNGNWAVEAYYTFLDGDVGGDPNSNIIQTLDFADELSLRVNYQF